ncbi:MAG: hypothetical protein JRJ59_07870, partial [Deltaproteobacteria bacterium]|nr:hypothetical protein [Deltaproteobacteria bacterium]
GYMAPALFVLLSFLVPGLGMALISQNPAASLFYLLVIGGWLLFVALVHLVVTRLVSGRCPFQATFRAAAYTSFTNLVGPIPYLGLVTHIFGLYLTSQALSVVHGLPLARAAMSLILVVGTLLLVNLFLAGALIQQMQ